MNFEKRSFIIALSLALMISSYNCKAAEVDVIDMKTGFLETPVGIPDDKPKFSWKLVSREKNVMQSAYQVLVSDDLEKLDSGEGAAWDSGKVNSDVSLQISYSGRPLESIKKYYWKVRVWDNKGVKSDWSAPSWFVTSVLKKEDWSGAKWIGYEEMPAELRLVPGVHELRGDFEKSVGKLGRKRYVVPLFRNEITITKNVKNAFMAVSGLGHYQMNINGEKVGNRFLSPGWTQYDKTSLYNMYEVTNLIKKGKNTIGSIVGNGFYNINTERYIKFAITYGAPTMICLLKIEYEDGSTDTIVSDKTWKTDKSPITFSSIYGGEDYNATLEQPGWDSPGFDDSKWNNVLITKGPKGKLKVETDHPLQVMEVFNDPEIRIIEKTPVYDFGQNASAVIKLKVSGKKGDKLRLHPGERLLDNGLINQRTSGTPYYFEYTLKGTGEEIWIPQFTYYGFRYVQVEGAIPKGYPNPENLPVIEELQSLHTRNSSPSIGKFRCSNELFNRIYDLIDWAVRSNLASVTTDCPHREKLGWLEETHLMGNSIRYAYEIHNLFDKMVEDMMESQTEEGLVPDISPEYVEFKDGFRDSPEWGSSCIIIPWYLYQWYGDEQVVKKAYPMMKRYLSYLDSKSHNYILDHGLGDWYDLGPRNPGPAQLTPKSLTATGMYYYDLTLVGKMAEMLGRQEDAEHYFNQSEKVRIAFNDMFFDEKKLTYSTGSQTSFAIPLYFGMVNRENREVMLKNLTEKIRQGNNALTSGDVGYRYLLQALQEAGYSDVIFDMNSRSDVPGYGYQLAKGATSLTESWKAEGASHNHMMLGHLMEWFYTGLGGIKQSDSSVAFKNIIIEPECVGDVKTCQTAHDSPYGIISCDWEKEGNYFEMTIDIPCNTTATVYLPVKENNSVVLNQKVRSYGEMKIQKRSGQLKAAFEVGSGRHHFVTGN